MEYEEVDIHAVRFFSSQGGLLSSTTNPDVTCKLPEGALQIGDKSFCRVSVQVSNIDESLVHKHMGKGAAISPVVTIEPIKRKFHTTLKLSIPIPGPRELKPDRKNMRVLISLLGWIFTSLNKNANLMKWPNPRMLNVTGSEEMPEWEDITTALHKEDGISDGRMHINQPITGRYAVVQCENSIMDVPATMNEISKVIINGHVDVESDNNPNVELLKASKKGDIALVKECLWKSDVNVNYQNQAGQTALHISCKEGHLDVARELLQKNADFTIQTKRGNTAIHLASFYGHTKIVRLLLDSECDVNLYSEHGFPSIYPAVLEMHCDVAKLLLSRGADVTWSSQDGLSLLLVAVFSTYDKDKTAAMVELLIKEIDLTKIELSKQMQDKGFCSHNECLYYCVSKRQAARDVLRVIRQRLVYLCTDLLQKDLKSIEVCQNGLKEVLVAIRDGDIEKATDRITQNFDVNWKTDRNITALHCASLHGHTELVEKLIELGADVNAQTEGGFTSLHLVSVEGYKEMVDRLLKAGASTKLVNKHGLRALDIAAEMEQRAVVSMLQNHEKNRAFNKTENGVAIKQTKERLDLDDDSVKSVKKGCCMC